MKRHSEEELSLEPEVDVVTAKTTTHQIRLIRSTNSVRQKKALTVICTMLFHNLFNFLNKLQNIPAVSYTVFPPQLTKYYKHTSNYGSVSVSKLIHDSMIASTFKCSNASVDLAEDQMNK